MDTSILHTRIAEYKSKASHPVSKEMILLFENWFLTIENYISDVELDNFALNHKILKLNETINLLSDMLIISGNADKLIINPDDEYVIEAISLLLKNKDRKNHESLSAISSLLQINSDKSFDSLKQLKEFVNG
jgi:hypothetical protein